MKFVTCELPKIAYAAFLLGVFSLSPLAKADLPPADGDVGADDGLVDAPTTYAGGMSLGDMRDKVTGFNVRLVGNTVYMDGRIPKACATGASVSMNTVPANADAGTPAQHQIRFIPGPDCKNAKKSGPMVMLNSPALFGASRDIPDTTVDGDICLVHNDSGPDICDSIPGKKYEANAKKEKAKEDAIALDAAAKKKKATDEQNAYDRKSQELVDQIKVLCANGDFAGIGQQIEAAKKFLGDVTTILAKVDDFKKTYYVSQMKKAKDSDSLNDAYQSFLDAANDQGWDTDDATNAYADKRVELVNATLSNGDTSTTAKAAAVRDMAGDFRDNDLMGTVVGTGGHTGKALVGAAYFTLAGKVRDGADTDVSKLVEAEKYYRESENYGDDSMKVKVEEEIARMYKAAADECLANAKDKNAGFNKCDALAKKEKGAIDAAIKAQGHIKGDDSLEALQGLKQSKIARFGMDGYSMNVSGYGVYNRAGGSYDTTKQTDYTQAQQQFIMQRYMQQSMGGAGMSTAGASTDSDL